MLLFRSDLPSCRLAKELRHMASCQVAAPEQLTSVDRRSERNGYYASNAFDLPQEFIKKPRTHKPILLHI